LFAHRGGVFLQIAVDPTYRTLVPYQEMMRSLVLILVALSASAQIPPLERILLPIYSAQPAPGAFGSSWETVLTIRNNSANASFMFPQNCPPQIPDRLCLTLTDLPPAVTYRPYLRGVVSARPVMLNVSKVLADQIAVQLRVREISAQSASYGVGIPACSPQGL